MSVSPFDSTIYGGLLSDSETASLFSDEAEVRVLLDVESALARAQADLGIIPANAAAIISRAARELVVTPESLRSGTASSGVPITALVASLRAAVGADADYVHLGATSQDIVDTALVIRLKAACRVLDARLMSLAHILAAQANAHRRTIMAGRTRFQQAVPITYGLKVAGWLSALCRHRVRYGELNRRLFAVQLGGAAGNLAALGDKGSELPTAFARELGLHAPSVPWHTQRDNLAEFAGWLSLVSGTLGKIGYDVLLMAQSEIAEVRVVAGGESSAMPHKVNPVAAEILVTLARANSSHISVMHTAQVQEHERSGSSWTLEWLALPQMVVATGAGLLHASKLMETLRVDIERMRRNVDAANGLLMAEAATMALTQFMVRSKAARCVAEACSKVTSEGGHLADVLAASTGMPITHKDLDPAQYLGSSGAFIDAALAEASKVFGSFSNEFRVS